MGAVALPVACARSLARAPASRSRPRAWSSRRCGSPACSTTWATGRSRTSSTTTFLAAFPAPAGPAPAGAASADPRGPLAADHRARARAAHPRPAPGARAPSPERDAFADGEAIDPRWVSFLVSKPALADASMPRWVRWLQPLLSGVFTVDNLDYVRRDAYLTGVAIGPVDVERLRRYAFISRARADALRAGPRRRSRCS